MKSYFSFSKSQKIGVVAIIIVIFFQIVILNKGNAIGVPDPFILDNSKYLMDKGSSYHKDDKFKDTTAKNYNKVVLHDFDPNSFSETEWIDYGFSEKQAKTIVSYKTKIGGFKKKQDLKKVYVISEQKYAELEPYIEIEQTHNASNEYKNKYETEKYVPIVIEINAATVDELIKIKGVGEYTAKGIVKYRETLGGYHSVNQLKEVYGISEENYEKIKPQIEINQVLVQKVNVNDLSVPELKKHPYITWKIANAMVEKRFVNKLSSIQFLAEEDYLTQQELDKLLPYISY